MNLDSLLKHIQDLKQVSQLILIDQEAGILFEKIENPKKMADMILKSSRYCQAIGKDRLSYLLFSRKNKKNLFIFPIANYYLGVIKNKDTNDRVLANNILNKINTTVFS